MVKKSRKSNKENASMIFMDDEPVIASAAAFAVILLSIAVDYSRSRALKTSWIFPMKSQVMPAVI